MSENAPYLASYAKSGSAFCGVCKEVFANNTLQLAVMNQTDVKNDIDNHWFHLNCFFTKEKPKSVEEIANFATLLKEDQKEVRSKIDETIALAEAEMNGLKSAPEMRDFFIEYAKSTSAGFLNCDDRFRSALKDDDEYLSEGLPQEFSDVLKKLDLKDETDDEEEGKIAAAKDEDKSKIIPEEPDKNNKDCGSKHNKIAMDDTMQINETIGTESTQHGNNYVTCQILHDIKLDCDLEQDNYYFGDNEFAETDFDQDDIGEDEIFSASEEDIASDCMGDCYESDEDVYRYEENYYEDLEQDVYDYGDSVRDDTLDLPDGDVREFPGVHGDQSDGNVWNARGHAARWEFDDDSDYVPK